MCVELRGVAGLVLLDPHGLADHDEAVRRAGDVALDQDQVAIREDRDDTLVKDGLTNVAHVAGHALALDDSSGELAHTDRAAVTEDFVGTVGPDGSMEIVALHDAGEATAPGVGDNIDLLTGLEQGRIDRAAAGVEKCLVLGHANFPNVCGDINAGLLGLTDVGLRPVLFLGLSQTEDNRIVAVATFSGLDAHDLAGAGLDNGHGDTVSLFIKEMGHSDFLAQNGDRHGGLRKTQKK